MSEPISVLIWVKYPKIITCINGRRRAECGTGEVGAQ